MLDLSKIHLHTHKESIYDKLDTFLCHLKNLSDAYPNLPKHKLYTLGKLFIQELVGWDSPYSEMRASEDYLVWIKNVCRAIDWDGEPVD